MRGAQTGGCFGPHGWGKQAHAYSRGGVGMRRCNIYDHVVGIYMTTTINDSTIQVVKVRVGKDLNDRRVLLLVLRMPRKGYFFLPSFFS